MPGIGAGAGTWKERARRAEAETEAARTIAHSALQEGEARLQRIKQVREETTTSLSWRLGAPLRRFQRAR